MFEINKKLRNFALKKGYDVNRTFRNSVYQSIQTMKHFNVDIVFDIGANDGRYAERLRLHGYRGKIVCFEPVKSVFRILQSKEKKLDIATMNYGIGDVEKEVDINVSKDTVCSSVLNMNALSEDLPKENRYVRKEKIRLTTLDEIYPMFIKDNVSPFLKIDVQGYEQNVLDGAANILENVVGMQIELNLVEYYDVGGGYMDLISMLEKKGFELYHIIPNAWNKKTFRLIAFDGIFIRS